MFLFYYVNSECCPGTLIRYSLQNPYTDQCDAVPGGKEEMVIPVHVMNKHNSLDRGRTTCRIEVCNDGKYMWIGSYCGKGPCDNFACNCEGGCIEGDPVSMFKDRYKSIVRTAESKSFRQHLP